MIITFLGAGSTVFLRNILGDVFQTPALQDVEIHLYDINGVRLEESLEIIGRMNKSLNAGLPRVRGFSGDHERRAALWSADFVINAIQVGGCEPATLIDFEIPARYGLRQTIGDTLGIGGSFGESELYR